MASLCPLKDRMEGKMSSERMRRTSFHTVLECSAVSSCSKVDTSQSFLEKGSQHLLRQWRTKNQKGLQKGSDGKCQRSCTDSCCSVLKSPHIMEGSHSNSCKCQNFDICLLQNPIQQLLRNPIQLQQLELSGAAADHRCLWTTSKHQNLDLPNKNFILLKSIQW